MSLWISWWKTIQSLRPAFSRWTTFMCLAVMVAGLTVRTELAGVTSIMRALNLKHSHYTTLLAKFHSKAIQLDHLSALWTQVVLKLFPRPGFQNHYQGPVLFR